MDNNSINAAYDNVLENNELPQAKAESETRTSGEFASFVDATTLDIDWDGVDGNDCYKEILIEGKQARYESLA